MRSLTRKRGTTLSVDGVAVSTNDNSLQNTHKNTKSLDVQMGKNELAWPKQGKKELNNTTKSKRKKKTKMFSTKMKLMNYVNRIEIWPEWLENVADNWTAQI
jgi:hypothetical protein